MNYTSKFICPDHQIECFDYCLLCLKEKEDQKAQAASPVIGDKPEEEVPIIFITQAKAAFREGNASTPEGNFVLGVVYAYRKLMQSLPGSENPLASYWFEKARLCLVDRNDFRAQLMQANEKIQQLTEDRKLIVCSNIPPDDRDGIAKEWIDIWAEVENWYGDIKKEETGRQFLLRLQAKYSPSHPSPVPIVEPGEKPDTWSIINRMYQTILANGGEFPGHIREVFHQTINNLK